LNTNLTQESGTTIFHLGEMITLGCGATMAEAPFVANDGMHGLRALISHMTNAGMMTDSAVLKLAPQCRAGLIKQYPWLSEIDVSGVTPDNHDIWLTRLAAKYGMQHRVAKLQ
jgi:hypothetical protein